jgi:DNA-binding NarL/FixJ family response regulator
MIVKDQEIAEPETQKGTIRAAIVEDEADIREGLAELIDATEGYRCTGRFRTMEDALARIEADLPDVALVDIGLPGMSGIKGIRILKERFPSLHALMLTVYDDDERIFDALCAGATGYLLKKTPSDRLLASLREAVEGGSPMSPEVARRVVELFRQVRPPESAEYGLTPHETRILRMFMEGHNYKTAAAELKVSVNTVAFHVKNIYSKLQVHSKSEAVAKALKAGLIR